jgi:hypothetical protein
MLDTKTLIPLYHQPKLHMEPQIRSGAWQPSDQVSAESGGDEHTPRAELTSENLDGAYKTYGTLSYCS